ncbi:hypothetical protein, partial [Paraburkholderia hospita]|uniref:hypothetical protein n=1 Tax=Paraburkholderia hospita TaxID=169430 RepID=UPI003BF96C62
MSDKIRAQHLTRKAMLYVRQSSAYQVSHNLESQKLQYAMQDRLRQLGWNEIEVEIRSSLVYERLMNGDVRRRVSADRVDRLAPV